MEKGLFLSKQDQFAYRQIVEFRSGRLSRETAARLLRVSTRTVSRLARETRDKGLEGVVHGNRGGNAHNRTATQIKTRVMNLVAKRYFDLNMLHCLEVLKFRHRIVIGRETFRKWCHEKQLVKRKKRRRSHPRNFRSRMPAEGYLLQMDGSPHRYNGRDIWSLILAIDDATSEIPHGEFFLSETTTACMQVLRRIVEKKGLPRALYVDKAGWAGGGKRVEFCQFHRACEELGIQVLFANSPEAKGRVERSFNTIQDRIIPELRLAKIKTMKRANRYLQKHFLPQYWNKRNTVPPEDPRSEYRRLSDPKILDEILCKKDQRAVDPGNCISLHGDTYLLQHPMKISLKRKRVELRHYDKKPMAVFLEGTRLTHRLVKHQRKVQPTWDEHIARLENNLR